MDFLFETGKVYNRRADIHERFGGQQQGGIITPTAMGAPIFLITGDAGAAHGYADRTKENGVFEYFGEGQVGDMKMLRGNRAIRDHAANGRDLLVFQKERNGLRFQGTYVFEDWHSETAPDTNGQDRQAIVFELRPLAAVLPADNEPETDSKLDLKAMRDNALEAVRSEPKKGQKLATAYERSRVICNYIYARADGRCENCRKCAPFLRANGTPYLEAHHIRRLSDGGPDDPRFMIALCPNCHRQAHSGADKVGLNIHMQGLVDTIEAG